MVCYLLNSTSYMLSVFDISFLSFFPSFFPSRGLSFMDIVVRCIHILAVNESALPLPCLALPCLALPCLTTFP